MSSAECETTYVPTEIPSIAVAVSPNLRKFLRYVISVEDAAHIDDAVEMLEEIPGDKLALVCGADRPACPPPESMWPRKNESFPSGLRHELFQELNEIELADSLRELEDPHRIGCAWLIDLLGEGKVE